MNSYIYENANILDIQQVYLFLYLIFCILIIWYVNVYARNIFIKLFILC